MTTGPGRAEIPLWGDMRSISGVKLKEVIDKRSHVDSINMTSLVLL